MTRGLWLGSRPGTGHSHAKTGKEWAWGTKLRRPNPLTGGRGDGTAAASVKPRGFAKPRCAGLDCDSLCWSGHV